MDKHEETGLREIVSILYMKGKSVIRIRRMLQRRKRIRK